MANKNSQTVKDIKLMKLNAGFLRHKHNVSFH